VADDIGASAKLGGDILDHLSVEGLVDGDKYAAHEQHGDQVFGADLELLSQILHADTLGYGDLARDGQRLCAELRAAIARRRHKALHWAFLHLGVLLASAASAPGGRALGPGTLGRRRRTAGGTRAAETRTGAKAGTGAETGTGAGRGWAAGRHSTGGVARRMLGARTAGEQARRARTLWSTGWAAVEDRFAALDARGMSWFRDRGFGPDRCLIKRSRTRLRHHHAPRWWSRLDSRRSWSSGRWRGGLRRLGHSGRRGRRCWRLLGSGRGCHRNRRMSGRGRRLGNMERGRLSYRCCRSGRRW